MWENINCGDFINCGRLSSLLWVVLNAIYYFVSLQMISKALHTGWSRERLCLDSGKVQRRPLNPWRLLGCQLQPQWAEVQRQVSQTLTQSENPQNEINNLHLPRDRDRDLLSSYHCSLRDTGGWWYKDCVSF